MSVPAGMMPPPGAPPMGPPPPGLGAPAGPPGLPPQDPNTMGMPAPGGLPQPTDLLAQMAQAFQQQVAQEQQVAQNALTVLAAALSTQPDPNSAAAVSAPGPITAAGSAPATDPTNPAGGYQ